MKTDCESNGKLLERFLDGELESSEAERVAAHLADCPDCRRELEQLRALDHLVRQDEPPPLADEYWDWHRREVWRRIRSGFRREYAPVLRQRFTWMRLATVAAGVAAIMIAVVGGWRLITGTPARVRPMRLTEESPSAPVTGEVARDRAEDFDAIRRGARAPAAAGKKSAAENELADQPAGAGELPSGHAKLATGVGGSARAEAPATGLVTADGTSDEEGLSEAQSEIAAVPPETGGQAAVARYEAFVDSVSTRLAHAKAPVVAAGPGDRSAKLLGYSPLPAAPGQDTVEVTVRALVRPDGSVIQVEVTRGTGDPATDSLLRVSFLRAQFEPATRGGQPVESWFELERELSPAPESPAQDSNQ